MVAGAVVVLLFANGMGLHLFVMTGYTYELWNHHPHTFGPMSYYMGVLEEFHPGWLWRNAVGLPYHYFVETWVGPGVVSVVLLLVGWRLRWPAMVTRCPALVRGLLLNLLCAAGLAAWLWWGWVPFQPICDYGWPADYRYLAPGESWELQGEMSPVVAESYHAFFAARFGPEDVRLDGPGRLLVRPLWQSADRVSIGKMLWKDAEERAVRDHNFIWARSATECEVYERYLMKDGRAEAYRTRAPTWPVRLMTDENQYDMNPAKALLAHLHDDPEGTPGPYPALADPLRDRAFGP